MDAKNSQRDESHFDSRCGSEVFTLFNVNYEISHAEELNLKPANRNP